MAEFVVMVVVMTAMVHWWLPGPMELDKMMADRLEVAPD
jgi:hypothetical protein